MCFDGSVLCSVGSKRSKMQTKRGKMRTGGMIGTRGTRETSSCEFWCLLEGLVIVFFMWVVWENGIEDDMMWENDM